MFIQAGPSGDSTEFKRRPIIVTKLLIRTAKTFKDTIYLKTCLHVLRLESAFFQESLQRAMIGVYKILIEATLVATPQGGVVSRAFLADGTFSV